MSDDMTKVAYLTAELERVRQAAASLAVENHRLATKINDRAALDTAWPEHMKAIQAGMERQNAALESISDWLAAMARKTGAYP